MSVAASSQASRFAAFAVVGTLGFLVDASVLVALIRGFHWSTYTARGVSIIAAITCTWALNRLFTFRTQSTLDVIPEYTRYVLVQLFGAIINYVTFASLVAWSPHVARFPVLAVAAGSIIAMVFNFIVLQRFVFVGTASSVKH